MAWRTNESKGGGGSDILSLSRTLSLSIYLSICCSIHPSIHPSIHLSYLSILSVYRSSYLSIHCLSIQLSVYLSIWPSIRLSYLSIYLKRSNSARLPFQVEVDRPKTRQFCEASSKNESAQYWKDEFCETSWFPTCQVKVARFYQSYPRVTLVSGNASRRTDVGVGEQQCWCRGTAMLVSGNMYVGVGRRAFMSGYIHFAHFLHFTHFVHFTHCLCTFCAFFTHFIQFRHFVHCSHFDMARMHRRIFWRTFYAFFTHFLRTFYALLVHFLRTLRNLPSLLALYAIFAHFLCPLHTVPSLGTLRIVRTLTWRACTNAFLTRFLRTFCALFTHFLRTFHAPFTHALFTFYALLGTFCALFTRFTQFRHACFRLCNMARMAHA